MTSTQQEIPEWEKKFDEKWDGCFSDEKGDYVNPQVKDFIRAEIQAAEKRNKYGLSDEGFKEIVDIIYKDAFLAGQKAVVEQVREKIKEQPRNQFNGGEGDGYNQCIDNILSHLQNLENNLK